MIAASALQADCDLMWSEDFQQGMLLDGRLRVLSPFIAAAWTRVNEHWNG